jgi:DNA-binding transcriptional LysR family regulator
MAMPKIRSQPVPYSEHPALTNDPGLNWEDVRVFLEVGRRESFRAAASELGISFNTVRRHVERLEHMTKMLLLARHAQGIELTKEGRSFLATAQRMADAANDVRRLSRVSPSVAGRVQISLTEGLGTFWIMPRLVSFQRAHPKIILEVNCTFREPDVSRMEADISIQLTRPKHSDLKTVRLGRLHVMPFASPDYLRTYGTPQNLREVESHKIVEQLSPQLDVTAVDRLFPGKPREGFVSMVTNTSTAHFWAVARGAGLGMLPTYLTCLGARIVPVDLDLTIKHDIWLSYHPDGKRLKRVGLAIDWLRENFNAAQFPWFGDEFVHPNELSKIDSSLAADAHFANLIVS